MAKIISGTEISASICEKLKADIITNKLKPGLAVILVGGDAASITYVNSKEKKAKEIGIRSEVIRMSDNTSQDEVIGEIKRLNSDRSINGILVQLPLPKHINEQSIIGSIEPKKDVDGLHPINMGKLMLGQEPYYYSCTPSGVMELIHSTNTDVKGKNAVVIGRSNIVGKPMAHLLMKEHATITICHSRTKDIGFYTRNADIVVVAIGKTKFLTMNMVKEGSIIIDVGMNRTNEGLCGDVDFENVSKVAGYITPVPKGVGPMTIAMLMKNCVTGAMQNRT